MPTIYESFSGCVTNIGYDVAIMMNKVTACDQNYMIK